jgi:carboxylesterase type B
MLASFTPEGQAAQELAKTNPMALIPPPDPRESEDCLFLDVLVPAQVFTKRQKKGYKGAPVMVWIYGGGFTFTDNSGNPAGLIRRSQERGNDQDGIIYVKMNYRVWFFDQIAPTAAG